jgi:hypothetical protein
MPTDAISEFSALRLCHDRRKLPKAFPAQFLETRNQAFDRVRSRPCALAPPDQGGMRDGDLASTGNRTMGGGVGRKFAYPLNGMI